jgi:hypothetical protein
VVDVGPSRRGETDHEAAERAVLRLLRDES